MLSLENINPKLLQAQYAVRGAIVQRAEELEKAGQKIIYCNIGNPQALGQKPLTYIRQTLSLLEYPELLQSQGLYPEDIINEAKSILNRHPHGIGAYTQSTGILFIREAIAKFINERDGIKTDPEHIMLTDGASKGVQSIIYSLLKNEKDGIMIPIPQYPLYSATLSLYGGKQINYFLDEDNNWSLNLEDLETSISQAKEQGINPVAIAVINPGNPTGAVLNPENIKMIIEFAQKHSIAILADEVYQENIYTEGGKFHSFSKIMQDAGITDVSLFSFHSVSKGYLGECGHRGGYLEMRNVPQDVLAQLTKLQSINLCSNVSGQLVTYLMINPPKPGEQSYDLYNQEKTEILSSLHKRAQILSDGMNSIEGVSLQIPQGAMYAFVKVELPEDSSIDLNNLSESEKAAYYGKINMDYCLALLEETGICVVPGSGFGQKEGSYHFRITFLPPLEEIEALVEKFRVFHMNYISR